MFIRIDNGLIVILDEVGVGDEEKILSSVLLKTWKSGFNLGKSISVT